MDFDEKLLEYERKLENMQVQINSLTKEVEALKDKSAIKPVIKPAEQNQYSLPVNNNTVQPVIKREPVYQNNNINTNVNTENNYKRAEKNYENVFGKLWMGIFASILVFIGFVMLATLIAPHIGDEIKFVFMLLFGILLSAFGIFKLKKDKSNAFFLSLSGCGVGLVYITLFMGYIYFEFLNMWSLYALLLVWCCILCALSRLNSMVFQIIGQLGVFISVLLGAYSVFKDAYETRFIVLVIYFIVTEIAFYIAHFNVLAIRNIVTHISVIVNAIVLYIVGMPIKNTLITVVLSVFVLLIFVSCIMLLKDDGEPYIGIIYVPYSIILQISSLIVADFNKEPYYGIIGFFFFGIVLICGHVKKLYKVSFDLVKCFSFVMMFFIACTLKPDSLFVMLVAFAAIALAYIFKDFVYEITGFLIALFEIIFLESSSSMYMLNILLLATMFATIIIVYNVWAKGIFVVSLYFAIIMIIEYAFTATEHPFAFYTFVVIALLNLILLKCGFARNLKTKAEEKAFYNFLSVINGILMIAGLASFYREGILHAIAVIVTVALFMANAKKQLEHINYFVNMYVGFKFTILLICILESYDSPNILISLSCLIFAILCIVTGFVIKKKALRVYGLIISNITIIKLVLFDYNYDSNYAKAFGLLISGALCFAISFLYTNIEKKNRSNN